ncbi:MAG: glycolate oxidase FAD binding subunit [Verrucomicrobiales bacterium]|jgi:glycolate oxidase FAD binding subunit
MVSLNQDSATKLKVSDSAMDFGCGFDAARRSGYTRPLKSPIIKSAAMPAKPETPQQLLEIVRESKGPVTPVGGRTKPALSQSGEQISMSRLSGILEYQPSEFTFTALAGTPLAEINTELEKNGQYLTFDPPLIDAGATLGGTLAAGLSGPGAYRFGSVRDFVLGIEFVDGAAKDLLRAGGKVVKNAAGWDLPKFFAGSYGRFGILTELTFKVFPCPPASATISWPIETIDAGIELTRSLSRGPWEIDALELDSDPLAVVVRLRGQPAAAETRIARLLEAHPGGARVEGAPFWKSRANFEWANPDHALVKVPLTPSRISKFDAALAEAGARRVYSVGGNLGWVSHENASAIDSILTKFDLSGAAMRNSDQILLGKSRQPAVLTALANTLAPGSAFPPIIGA